MGLQVEAKDGFDTMPRMGHSPGAAVSLAQKFCVRGSSGDHGCPRLRDAEFLERLRNLPTRKSAVIATRMLPRHG
jgi:hypothetical protein